MKVNKTWIVTGSLATIVVAGVAAAATADNDPDKRELGSAVTLNADGEVVSPGSHTPAPALAGPGAAADSAMTPGEAVSFKAAVSAQSAISAQSAASAQGASAAHPSGLSKTFAGYSAYTAPSAPTPAPAPAPAPAP
ncbi:MAG TPA: hypothetical protein GX743_07020, partial [Actinomycetales bacterium]|nr:hypothetical protein [Actinomycetales bacterium]